MVPTTPTILADVLRCTLQLVQFYGDADAYGPELDELTTAIQRAIAAIEAEGTNGHYFPAREANSATQMKKSA